MEGASVISEPPILRNFSGHWTVDLKRSDPIDKVLEATGYSYLARKAIKSVESSIVCEITHIPWRVTFVDRSKLGKQALVVLLDNKPRKVQYGERLVLASGLQENDSGDLVVEVRYPDGGRTVDARRLLSRDLMRQTYIYYSPNSLDAKHVCNRVFTRADSLDESAAALATEESLKVLLQRLGVAPWPLAWTLTGSSPVASRGT